MESDSQAPKIVYPCIWVYAVIGVTEENVRTAIANAVQTRQHTVKFSKRSQQGSYCSLHLEVIVKDEAERNNLYQALKKGEGIKMVL